MKCYFFDFSQRRQGPYPDLWIAHLVRAGELDGNVQVWGEQIGEWTTWNDYVIKSKNYIECPYCGAQLKIEPDWLEKKLQCAECDKKFHISQINSLPLWEVFDKITDGTLPSVQRWFFERERLHPSTVANMNIRELGLVPPYLIAQLKPSGHGKFAGLLFRKHMRENEGNMILVNHIVSIQIFLLCCLVLDKQLRRTGVLEFREYCILSGLDAAAFDKILSCELSKAFIAVNHDSRDHNEVYYFKNIADYYNSHIKCDKGTFFAPIYNGLIPWYHKIFLRNVSVDNYLTCLADLKKLVAEPDFLMFSCILKDVDFKDAFEKIICTKIASDNFSKKEFGQVEECLAALPFGMEWLYKSDSIRQCIGDHCIKQFDLILCGEQTVMPDFACDMLTRLDDVNDRIAEKLLPVIVDKKMNFEEIRHIFDILEYFGFGIHLNTKLFTLRFICPYLLSEDTSAVFSFSVLLAKQADLPCPECTGEGKVRCKKCHGSGKINCRRCDGTGADYSIHFHREINCRECHGKGELKCDNGCRKYKGVYIVECEKCDGSGTVPGVKTTDTGTFSFDHRRCFVLDEKSEKIPFDFPLKKTDAPAHMDDAMTSFCEGKDCFFFADKNGRIFCAKEPDLVDPGYMIDVISEFYANQPEQTAPSPRPIEPELEMGPMCNTEQPFSVFPDKPDRHDATRKENPSGRKAADLTENEKIYLKSFMVANKDGIIDAAERKMLEYQAFNILKLTPERVGELEAMAQFQKEGEVR